MPNPCVTGFRSTTIMLTLLRQLIDWKKCSEVIPGLFLGSIPIKKTLCCKSKCFTNDLKQISEFIRSKNSDRPLKLIVPVLEPDEVKGEGFLGIQTIDEDDLKEYGVERESLSMCDYDLNANVDHEKAAKILLRVNKELEAKHSVYIQTCPLKNDTLSFKQGIIISLFLLFTLFFLQTAKAVESHNRFWTVGIITGPIACNSSFKYYLEPQIRLEDNQYKFNQFLFLGGLGYQFNPALAFYVGPGWVVTKTNQGLMIHEYRIWQQLGWNIFKNLNSRTRLEQRRNLDAAGLSWRFRERLWLRIPFSFCPNYSLSMFDEVFFNLNHPHWVSISAFEQNRAFLGIGAKIAKSTIMDVGYLNQYLFSATPQMNHVVLLSFTVSF